MIEVQTIDTANGDVEYTWPLTLIETTGKDISGDTVQLSLGTYPAPGTWLDPVEDTPADTSQRVVKLLIGNDPKPAPGTHYLWSKIGDTPETIIRRHQQIKTT